MLRRQKFSVKLGIFILAVLLFVGIFGPKLAPYDPYQMGKPYQKPSAEHLLGTNDVGQDLFSELIYGARVSLIIGIISAITVTVIGTTIGITSGYYGGAVDRVLMEIASVFQAVPSLPVTIVLVAFLSASIKNLVIAICITAWSSTARIVRSRVMQIKTLPFIRIEQTMGAPDAYIMIKHVLPNIANLVFVRGVLAVGSAMLTEASLSFLGLGVIGQKSWGGTLHYAFFRNGVVNGSWWWYLPPIICISLSVLGFMLLGQVQFDKPAERRN